MILINKNLRLKKMKKLRKEWTLKNPFSPNQIHKKPLVIDFWKIVIFFERYYILIVTIKKILYF
tara:strand:+ start:620 stop:811 length:192 start_codon:yes stop_codon:yes gene_type:complete